MKPCEPLKAPEKAQDGSVTSGPAGQSATSNNDAYIACQERQIALLGVIMELVRRGVLELTEGSK